MDNIMKNIKIDKVTLHCSSGDKTKLEKYMKLLKFITGMEPKKTISRKRIPAFKISPGMEIGCKVTLRKNKSINVLKQIFTGIPVFKNKWFNPGFLSFGVQEYIQIPGIAYQREIGILGFDVLVTLKRAGYNVKLRKRAKAKLPKRHIITKQETMEFFKKNFDINIEE